jgi:hypothetical protein
MGFLDLRFASANDHRNKGADKRLEINADIARHVKCNLRTFVPGFLRSKKCAQKAFTSPKGVARCEFKAVIRISYRRFRLGRAA